MMNKIIGKDAVSSKKKFSFQVGGKTTINSMEIASNCNNFFSSIGPELANNIVSTTVPMSYVAPCNNIIVISPVTTAEVRKAIQSQNTSSAEWDDFPRQEIVAKQSTKSYIDSFSLIDPSKKVCFFPR